MKKQLSLALLSLCLSAGLGAQTCLSEGIQFRFQQEIDDFAVNYPGCSTITGPVYIYEFFPGAIDNLNGLEQLTHIANSLTINGNTVLANLQGLHHLKVVEGIYVDDNDALTDMSGLGQLDTIRNFCSIIRNNTLTSLTGLGALRYIGHGLGINSNPVLQNLNGLENLNSIAGVFILENTPNLTNIEGLQNLEQIGGDFLMYGYKPLGTLNGLENLKSVGGIMQINDAQILDFTGLGALTKIGKSLYIQNNALLGDTKGLENLKSIGENLVVSACPQLTAIKDLNSLDSIGKGIILVNNPNLNDISGLAQVPAVKSKIEIRNNPQLSDCAIQVICRHLSLQPAQTLIESNGPNCVDEHVLRQQCQFKAVRISVWMDVNGNCIADAGDMPVSDVQVRLRGSIVLTSATGAGGDAEFEHVGLSAFDADLPEFPSANWAVCQFPLTITPAAGQDTVRGSLLLQPLNNCPQLDATLSLPPLFRGCAEQSDIRLKVRNTGTIAAQGATAGVIMPASFELISSSLPLSVQLGDTLFFDLGTVDALATQWLKMTVRTRCGQYIDKQSVCWSAFGRMNNACSGNSTPAPKTKISAECIGDTTLRFTLQNIGDATPQAPYTYTLIKNLVRKSTESFQLDPQEALFVDVPAAGATWRLEATRSDDGSLTALSVEACGGLAPGVVTAFWQAGSDAGLDFDCRQIVEQLPAYQPAVFPTGIGPNRVVMADQALEYIIPFQNTGPDTVHMVRIQNELLPDLDAATFRPIASSHPFVWKIINDCIVEVTFPNPKIPAASQNEAASHGFFSFSIKPKAGAMEGAYLNSYAEVYLDQNPPQWVQTSLAIGKISDKAPPCQINQWNLNSQADVDAIANTGCQVVEGIIDINGQDITNLNGLRILEELNGDLYIRNCPDLLNLNGLNELLSAHSIYIQSGLNLQNLSGLDKLKTLSGNLEISFLDAITEIGGLNKLETIGGYLQIRSNNNMQAINGFQALKSVGAHLVISQNPYLINFDAFERLQTVQDSLDISENLRLKQVDGFDALESVGGSLLITVNPSLKQILPMDSLRTTGRNLVIGGNRQLTDIGSFDALVSVGNNLEIGGTDSLKSLPAFPQLKSIGGNLDIIYCTALDSVNGFNALQSLGGRFYAFYNLSLKSISGFGQLADVGNDIQIRLNRLETVGPFASLKHVGKTFWIGENYELLHIYGFDALETVGENFSIFKHDKLLDIIGFHALQRVENGFGLSENYELGTIDGFHNLSQVGANFKLTQNYALEYLSELESLTKITGGLEIVSNAALPNLLPFKNLTEIGTYMHVIGCGTLTNLSGLDSLRSAPYGLEVRACNNLESLAGLGRIDTVGSITIKGNPLLQELGALDSLVQAGPLEISNNSILPKLDGLRNLRRVGAIILRENPLLADLSSFKKVEFIGGNLELYGNPALVQLDGLEQVKEIGGHCTLLFNVGLQDLSGLSNLNLVSGSMTIYFCHGLSDLSGLDSLKTVAQEFYIQSNDGLTALNGLNELVFSNELFISGNPALEELNGLEKFQICNRLHIVSNPKLVTFNGLDSLQRLIYLNISFNPLLQDFQGMHHLSEIILDAKIESNPMLSSLDEFDALLTIGALKIADNDRLKNLQGLETLTGQYMALDIVGNDSLGSITELPWTLLLGSTNITGNPMLSVCDVPPVCMAVRRGFADISNNAPGCNSAEEVKVQCGPVPIQVTVLTDLDMDCIADSLGTPVADAVVLMFDFTSQITRPTNSLGKANFEFPLNSNVVHFVLPQYPTQYWQVCSSPSSISVDMLTQPTAELIILLQPIPQCPDMQVTLGLPPHFRGCFVESGMHISALNSGTVTAEAVQLALIMPPVFDLLDTDPPLAAQSGDTLFFDLGDVPKLTTRSVDIVVKTRCDTFLFGHTLCIEAFSITKNDCPDNAPPEAELKLRSECLGDTVVQFTVRNIGQAPTAVPHYFRIIRNTDAVYEGTVHLNPQQDSSIRIAADGATYRMEVVKKAGAGYTAAAIEGCKGLTTGQITQFWLDKGPENVDVDCREVIGAFDPNQKTVVPQGVGPDHLIEANVPLLYTIDFQNTGTDTAFRVLLRDVLHPNLYPATFRPVNASHPYTWQIKGNDTLEVLFFPIALPDSNVNEPASHGFFTFEINQLPDLPLGTVLENTASIIFDFNPPIITNTVRHTIGQLLVRVDEPQQHPALWRVWGNPTRDVATFVAAEDIPSEKRFDLFDPLGRPIRSAQFSGQSYEFRREGLPAGWYVFRIMDARGRAFSGKIMVVD
ncbi:MAG: hypothetical protein ACKVU2_01410 [Saprospiraceae bacterium]